MLFHVHTQIYHVDIDTCVSDISKHRVRRTSIDSLRNLPLLNYSALGPRKKDRSCCIKSLSGA